MEHLFQKPAAGNSFDTCPDSEQWKISKEDNKTELHYDDNLDSVRKFTGGDDSANDQLHKGWYSKNQIVFHQIVLIKLLYEFSVITTLDSQCTSNLLSMQLHYCICDHEIYILAFCYRILLILLLQFLF